MTAARWPVITCTVCGSTGPGRRKAGLCKRCYARAWRQARPCASCGQDRPHLAAGLCARCYRLSRTRLVLCPDCGELRPVHFADRCERCKRRAAARAGTCNDCGKQVARLWSGRCRSCDAKSREVTGACRDCGDLTKLESGLCKACRLFRWAHPAGTCPWCGRQQPIGAAGACRSCQPPPGPPGPWGSGPGHAARVVLPPAVRTRQITGACADCGDLTWLSGGWCEACRGFRRSHPAGTCPGAGAAADRRGRGVRSCQAAARAARRSAGRPGHPGARRCPALPPGRRWTR